MEIEKIADSLKALGDPTRLQMVAMLKHRDCCVCEFVPVFGISQPAISKHLYRLKSSGLVRETRKGQWVFYSLNPEQFDLIGFSLAQLPDLSEKLHELEKQGLLVQCD
ncbi:helix-turn-helix transcriptional regulator [Ammoniphilus sp. CFH 90114]|uniref:ArsR/SmtB family transcription factor n=1 Tax=Ammoniphilus sp. CFH 90114 TaxID=2493665 RepID=UPI00100E078F|nr:metalloregulator ArsR/SmtB family transcription factor [Ammoniphilus sp. CFH 90114]RXT07861.1 ArsR family transcriptional regulator [Ammoniphilus sp. CFH 90114]